MQPPAPGTPSNEKQKNGTQHQRNQQNKPYLFGPVLYPRSPALHGLLIPQRKRVPVDTHRQLQNLSCNQQNRDKDKSLQKTIFGKPLGEIAHARRNAESQEEPNHNHTKKNPDEIQRVTGSRIRNGFLIPFVRERVLLRVCFGVCDRRIRGGLWSLRRRRTYRWRLLSNQNSAGFPAVRFRFTSGHGPYRHKCATQKKRAQKRTAYPAVLHDEHPLPSFLNLTLPAASRARVCGTWKLIATLFHGT